MKIAKYLFFGFFIGLVACGEKSDSKNGPAPAPSNDNKLEDVSRDYTQTLALTLFSIPDELKNLERNTLSFKGLGEKSVYKALYTFNSQKHKSFKVLEIGLKSSFSNCSAPEAKMTLIGKKMSRAVSLTDQINIEPYTDYVLDVSFVHSCKELEMDFNLIAWAGDTSKDPKIAITCYGYQTTNAVFFSNVGPVTGFTPGARKEYYLSSTNFCGEKFRGEKTLCSTKVNVDSSLNGFPLSHAECISERANEKRKFSIDFDSEAQSVVLSCMKNDVNTYAEGFHSCRSSILDYGSYRSLLDF